MIVRVQHKFGSIASTGVGGRLIKLSGVGLLVLALSDPALANPPPPPPPPTIFMTKPELSDVGKVPIQMTLQPYIINWTGDGSNFDNIFKNTSGYNFTDMHISVQALQSSIVFKSFYFRDASCTDICDYVESFKDPAKSFGDSEGGIAKNSIFRILAFDFAVPQGVTSYTISIRPSIPEPAVWVSMLAGFGAVGTALRARRRVASVRN